MTSEELKGRTRAFALRVMKLVDALPKTTNGRAVGSQLVRCAMSAGANYHIACRARSKKEFIAKLGIVLEEADETQFWLLLIIDAEMQPKKLIDPLLEESRELTAIFTAAIKTATSN